MREQTTGNVAPVADTPAATGIRSSDLVRWGLLLTYLVFLGSVVLTGTRGATVAELEQDLGSGRVEVVQVSDPQGAGDSPATGQFSQYVRCHGGLLDRQLKMAWAKGVAPAPEEIDLPANAILNHEVGAWLQEQYGVKVERVVETELRPSGSINI